MDIVESELEEGERGSKKHVVSLVLFAAVLRLRESRYAPSI